MFVGLLIVNNCPLPEGIISDGNTPCPAHLKQAVESGDDTGRGDK